MSFGFFGIQFGFALQNANVSRIFETLDAPIDKIPILWIAAPVTGLIIQPIIGHMSDNTWGRLGRRRPYFLTGALLASTALFFMPNSPTLWIAAGTLWIMDASINISMEPFRAFVGDMLPSEQRTTGFAMQSFFIGTGAVIASLLPYVLTNWFNVSTVPLGDARIPPNVKWSFYIGGSIFLLSVLWTVITTREYSPEELKKFNAAEEQQRTEDHKPVRETAKIPTFYKTGIIWIFAGLLLSLLTWYIKAEAEVYILSIGLAAYGLLMIIAGIYKLSLHRSNGLVTILTDLNNMPATMKQLAVVQFFSWFALFAMWIYTTAGVTSFIYGTNDTKSALYNTGANWVGVLFGVYNGFAAIVAFLLPVLAKKTGRKTTHAVALIAGGVGLASIFLFKNPVLLIIPMLGIGFAWASILSMPYAILTGSLPPEKMGTYMGIFNFFIVIPQILAASILGFMVRHLFADQAIYALVLGGVSMILAAGLVFWVNDVDDPRKKMYHTEKN
ncbi:MAG: MFS transporter [Bacteroidales bacterium]|nr:MFS transporter [Bacteroidales bacterium]